jgi:hypothetical protein
VICNRCHEVSPAYARHCRRCGETLPQPTSPPAATPATPANTPATPAANTEGGMVISLNRGKRVVAALAWVGTLAVVAGVLVLLFVKFTDSFRIAVAVVVFMLVYMLVVSNIVMRNRTSHGE